MLSIEHTIGAPTMSAQDVLDNDHSGLLSDATLTALQLHHQPFTSLLRDVAAHHDDAAQQPPYFSDAITDEQLADIKQALITGDDLLLVLGESGSGKSTLLEQLTDNSGLRIQCFSVNGNQRFSAQNLFTGMLEAFKHKPPEKLKDILDELIPYLQSMVARNTLSAVVLDDAQLASKSELTQLLSAMLYMNSQDETLMRVALGATGDFEDKIPDLLPDGADLPYSILSIEGYTPSRAAAYIDHRLQLAGFDQEFPFTERDMASLVDHSDGRPAELHALTADVLNEKYGRLDEVMPQELIGLQGPGFFHTRMGKLVLGAAATIFIIGGLLMFMPQGTEPPRDVTDDEIAAAEPDFTVTDPTQLTLPEPAPAAQPESPDRPLVESPVDSDQADTTAPSADLGSTNTSADTSTIASNDPEVVPTPDSNAEITIPTNTDSPAAETATVVQPTNPTVPVDTPLNTASSAVNEITDAAEQSNEAAESAAQAVVDLVQEAPTELAQNQDQSPSDEPSTDSAADTTNTETASEEDQSVADDSQLALAADTTSNNLSVEDELTNLLESPSWILVQDESQYTIQLSASRDLASVRNFLRRNSLPGPSSIFSFERNGEVWYALVHGVFPTLTDARRAVEQMPDGAQRDQPWIRSISRVKSILREQ